jgi:hypothetical protein
MDNLIDLPCSATIRSESDPSVELTVNRAYEATEQHLID